MTVMIARAEAASPSNPVLVLSAITRGNTVTPELLARPGMLLDVYSASWRILDGSDPTRTPVQLATGTIDTTTDRLSKGRYAATWTAPLTEALGEHWIEWTFRFNAADPPIVATDRFEVIDHLMRKPGYCTVQDLKDEGFTSRDADNKRMWLAINKATAYVHQFCGRVFDAVYNPNYKTDGTGARTVLLDQPIVALASLTLDTSPFSPADLPVDASLYRVYSRHITQNLTLPDDRENPKIELFYSSEDLVGRRAPYAFTSLIFPRGQQNVQLEGIFGYTDPDGGTVGCTPPLIRHATMLIAAREMYKLKSGRDERVDARGRGFLVSETTRDQSYSLDPKRNEGLAHSFTGDPEIDQILLQYVRPPQFGAA